MLDTYNGNRRLEPTIDQSPDTITDHRASQPSHGTAGRRRHTENNEWIQTHDLSTQRLQIHTGENLHTGSCRHKRSRNGRGEGVTAAGGTELEERVPVQLHSLLWSGCRLHPHASGVGQRRRSRTKLHG